MGKPHSSAQPESAPALSTQLRGVLGRLRRRLRATGDEQDLAPSQTAVLLRLEKDGAATVSNLARAEGMRPQSMSAIVALLLDAGLVAGAADPQDGRKTVMSLTKKCERWMTQARAARQDWLTSAIREKLSTKEQATLAASLPLLARLADD